MNHIVSRWIVVLLLCSACEPTQPTTKTMKNPVTAVVTVLRPGGAKTVRVSDDLHIKLIEGWLQEVKSTQLPQEQLGVVGPWCTITFYAGPTATSTNEIFASDGRTTRRELLTDEQRQKLIDIIDKK